MLVLVLVVMFGIGWALMFYCGSCSVVHTYAVHDPPSLSPHRNVSVTQFSYSV
jgi:hypothetical protein